VDGQADLLEVVLALDPGSRLAHLLHRGHEETDQDRDDGDHHQQLNEGESPTGVIAQPIHGNLQGGNEGKSPRTAYYFFSSKAGRSLLLGATVAVSKGRRGSR
jgi:hypothetical protein